jgi:hypothetical protein
MKKGRAWPTSVYTKLRPLLDLLHSVYGIVFFKFFLIEKKIPEMNCLSFVVSALKHLSLVRAGTY